ncbi:hypothetical protein [Flammeovirga aprica]|uniref:Uncharacterized protein n=1 Tax=Flammeovirga aprica JL-4 TaxID=694437 RepID=A0A7X9XB81_9BACT|nr:hypothetical protein [Flammeovirga aprica]NME70450.1 hypothetical protein [Flammeovirga aprica JL-4]
MSCDHGENLYIRNFESDTLKVQLHYPFRMEHKGFIFSDQILPLDEIKNHTQYYQKLQYDYDSIDRKLKFNLLPKSTTFIPISTIGYFEYIKLQPNDTIWLTHNINSDIPVELLSKKGMQNLIFDIKMDILKQYLSED